MGKMRNAQYRIVVADSRTKRDGRAIEEIGIYQPKEEPSLIRVDSDRAQYWLGVGAQPTEAVAAILKITGDWQKFKGLPGAEGTLRVAEPKVDKKSVFEAAALDAANEPEKPATTPKKKAEAPKADEPVAAVEVVEVAEAADGTVVVDDIVAVEEADGTVVVDEVVEVIEPDGTVEAVEVVEVVDADGTVEAAEVVAEEIPADETTEA
jgi:small subunit ribosomal protein S16